MASPDHIRIPARAVRLPAASRFVAAGVLLITSISPVVAELSRCHHAPCVTHNADGADTLLADLLLTLVRDDLAALEQLEERITNLEQEVLADNTDTSSTT